MSSLAVRIGDLITAIGTDVKTLNARQKLYIQGTQPTLATGEKALWINTSVDPPVLWVQDGT